MHIAADAVDTDIAVMAHSVSCNHFRLSVFVNKIYYNV